MRETKESMRRPQKRGPQKREKRHAEKHAEKVATLNQEKQRIEANAAAEISELKAALAFLTSHGPD